MDRESDERRMMRMIEQVLVVLVLYGHYYLAFGLEVWCGIYMNWLIFSLWYIVSELGIGRLAGSGVDSLRGRSLVEYVFFTLSSLKKNDIE